MDRRKVTVQEVVVWTCLALAGGGGVAAGVSGSGLSERVASLEAVRVEDARRLERIEHKLDALLERGR